MKTLQAETLAQDERGSVVSTDVLVSFGKLEREGYTHVAVTHGAKEWAVFDCRTQQLHHTNGVESFWWMFDRIVAAF